VAQFELFANPNPSEREGFPFVVDIQSRQLAHLPTRLVMPLPRLGGVPQGFPRRLAQTVSIDGESLYLAAHQCAALPARLLRQPLRSVAEHQGAIRDALDAVINGV
jgi:toxin CcdB